ncbi:MAG: ABC-type transport auxiliary lipoprotein family protein [Sulfuriferula sp.]
MSMKNYLIAAMVTLSLSGCISLAGNQNAPLITSYVLEDAGHPSLATTTNPRTLLILDTATNAFYNTDSIAFSRAPGTRGLYQYARWAERPGKRFNELLLARLDADRIFATVASSGSGIKGDWLLDTRLLAFYHQASTPPGSVRVELRAEVTDLRHRTLVARKLFTVDIPAPTYNAAGAVSAFNSATGKLLDDIGGWLETLPSQESAAIGSKLP